MRVNYKDPSEFGIKVLLVEGYMNWQDFLALAISDHKIQNLKKVANQFFENHFTDEELDLLDLSHKARQKTETRPVHLALIDSVTTFAETKSLTDTDNLKTSMKNYLENFCPHNDLTKLFIEKTKNIKDKQLQA